MPKAVIVSQSEAPLESERAAAGAVRNARNPDASGRAGWSFPRTARLLRPEEFAAVLRQPPKVRNTRFALHARPRPSGAWRLGLTIPKKQEPKAVRRNLVKRAWREAFRKRAALFDGRVAGHDLVVRLQSRLPDFPPSQLRRMCRADAEALLSQILARLPKASVS